MKINSILATILTSIILISCGSPFAPTAGTGQQGEARVIGIAYTANGTVASNQQLVVASQNYIVPATEIRSRAAASILDTISTDESGHFSFTMKSGERVTISGRIGNDFIYLPVDSTGSDELNLGGVSFKHGVAVKVYPWWNPDGSDDGFTIEGTGLTYRVSDDSVSTIYVPADQVKLVHYDQTGPSSVDIAPNETIGDSALWDSTSFDSTALLLDDSVMVGYDAELTIGPRFPEPYYYGLINWGDGSAKEMSKPIRTLHRYGAVGNYSVTVDIFKATDPGGLNQITSITRNLVVTVADSSIVPLTP